MKKINYNNQQGFSILSVILVIVAVIVAIGIWALSGQTDSSSSGNSLSNMQASSIINDATAIKTEYDRLLINGADNILFRPNVTSTSTVQNILDPTNGVPLPNPSKNALRTNVAVPEGIWVYGAFRIQNVGIQGNADVAIRLAGIKDSVCQSINLLIKDCTVPLQFHLLQQ